MRPGFRKVVFAILIMLIVLFYAQGIMGDREFSWDRFITWWRTRPDAVKAWPAKRKAKRDAKKAALKSKADARAKSKSDKAEAEARKASGEALFSPLPMPDEVVVFGKEGR